MKIPTTDDLLLRERTSATKLRMAMLTISGQAQAMAITHAPEAVTTDFIKIEKAIDQALAEHNENVTTL